MTIANIALLIPLSFDFIKSPELYPRNCQITRALKLSVKWTLDLKNATSASLKTLPPNLEISLTVVLNESVFKHFEQIKSYVSKFFTLLTTFPM